MAELLSPLAPVLRAGRYGNAAARSGVTLSEPAPGSIVQVVAWPGQETALLAVLSKKMELKVENRPRAGTIGAKRFCFGIGPGKLLIIAEDEGLAENLTAEIASTVGVVTDLSHGRTSLRVEGSRAEWVLAKLFAIDFSPGAFPVGDGVATKHHEIFAQIQRTAAERFDIYVFRSFARSFWHTLTQAAEEVGYEVR